METKKEEIVVMKRTPYVKVFLTCEVPYQECHEVEFFVPLYFSSLKEVETPFLKSIKSVLTDDEIKEMRIEELAFSLVDKVEVYDKNKKKLLFEKFVETDEVLSGKDIERIKEAIKRIKKNFESFKCSLCNRRYTLETIKNLKLYTHCKDCSKPVEIKLKIETNLDICPECLRKVIYAFFENFDDLYGAEEFRNEKRIIDLKKYLEKP